MAKIKKTALDKDLKKIGRFESASRTAGLPALKLALGLLFLLVVFLYAWLVEIKIGGSLFVVFAAVIGGYMALNIGANDVANTMGPAVGSRALTMAGALAIAAVFHTSGALIAGGDVVATVSKGIIDIDAVGDTDTFIWAMLAALLAAAVWVNLATFIGAPVSTTHAIVGGVAGAGIAAATFSAVNWPIMGAIAASWVISPLLGGAIAAAILFALKQLVLFKDEKIEAAKRWVPIFVAIMAAVFSVYLVTKGLKRVWKPGMPMALAIGGATFFIGWTLVHPIVREASKNLENSRKAVASLFKIPLICSTALLAFAHGANDVANAIGPLAAIVSAVSSGGVDSEVTIPLWVMTIGGFGIAVGLAIFGPKLIRTVGEKITKLDIVRAYAVALAAATTVIIASTFGLPVSSTHIAIGGVFGVGFLREAMANRSLAVLHAAKNISEVAGGGSVYGDAADMAKLERKALKKIRKRKLVRRRYFFTIIAAWLITVPLAALLGAMFFFMLRGMLLP